MAFAVLPHGHELDIARLRAVLEQRLPEYMLPADLLTMARMPLSGTGKINRAALVYDPNRAADDMPEGSCSSDLEQGVADVFARHLSVQRVSRATHFFGAGGHSLLAIRAVSELSRSMDIRLSVAEMFWFPTPATLAARIEALRAGSEGPAPPGRGAAPADSAPLASHQGPVVEGSV